MGVALRSLVPKCKASVGYIMDEAELKLQEADSTWATREYAWFAITLLCIMAIVAIKLQT